MLATRKLSRNAFGDMMARTVPAETALPTTLGLGAHDGGNVMEKLRGVACLAKRARSRSP